jgi:DNA-directed RNA polymerase specialized sigma24 family protein
MSDLKSLPSSEDPEEALAAVVALRLMADRLEREAVKKAVSLGWTWAQIAEALGVTRQAAHKRHASSIKKLIE